MAGCELSQAQIEQAVTFHGHWCPGLAIGLRAGEYALRELGRAEDEEVVAVVETDMCGVDAIQVLTGCTLGKGNLIYRDLGKMAFSFYRRADGRGVRLVFDFTRMQDENQEFSELNAKWLKGELGPEDEAKLMRMRQERSQWIMSAPLEELFAIKQPDCPMPHAARIMRSLVCAQCGESAMESRTRQLEGRTLCIPCFEALERAC